MYALRTGVTKTKKVFSAITILASIGVLMITGIPAAIFSASANANPAPSTIYESMPNNVSNMGYPSEAFEATSTSEFGDYIHLGGSNRVLNKVSMTMVDWAKYSDYSSNPSYSGNSTSWSMPMTLNVYDNTFDGNGTPTHKIATVTQDQSILWRPESDPSCGSTSNGNGWKVGGVCYNYSGIASNITFDLSSLNVTLPDDIVVTIAFNTQNHGYSPNHAAGPYNSLNVAVPNNQSVSVGSDNDTDGVVANSTWTGGYGDNGLTGVLRKNDGWSPYGTVPMEITATTPPTVGPCTTTGSVNSTSLSGWDLSQTRSAGHNQLTANGLHVYTDNNSSNAKAAGYYPTDFPLSGLGDQTIAQSFDYTTNSGSIAPGLQLAVDFDHNGTPDGYLVGESVYGNNWWLSGSASQFVKDHAPHNGGGYGSQWHGTPNEWLAAFPDAQVMAVGYSLGSGVQGDYTIHRITLGCTDYTFSLAAPTLIAPQNGATANGSSITNSWSSVEGAAKYEYQSFNDAAGHNLRYDGKFTATSKTATNVADGTVFYWRVRAIDSSGAAGPWSNNGGLWKITVDSSKPSTPTLLTPGNGAYENTNDFYFTWTDSSDSGSPVTYEFKSSQNSHTTNGVLDTGVWDNIDNGNSEQKNLTSPKIHSTGAPDGTWYWQVRAIDTAGNKSDWSSVWHMTIDTQTPAAPTNLSWKDSGNHAISNGGYTNSYSGTASWQDSSSDVDHYIYKYWNNIGSSPYNSVATAWTTPVGSTSLPGSFNQGEGTHYFCVEAVDAAGNTSACSATFTVIYDSSAPDASITSPNAGDTLSYAHDGTVALKGTVTDAHPDHYYFKISGPGGYSYSRTVNDTSSFTNQTFYNWNLHGLQSGTYTIDLEARDAAGNKDAGSVDVIHVTVDNTAPVVTVDTQSTTDTTPTVTGTVDDPAAGVIATVNGHQYTATVSSTANLAGTYPWSADVTNALTAGNTYDVAATATDAVGNVGTDTTTDELTITSVPAPVVFSSTNAGNVFTTAFVQGGNGGAPTTFAAVTNGGAGGGTGTNAGVNNGGQVLGASTDSTGSSTGGGTVSVKSASDTKDNHKNSSAFLGLGWWWLPVVVALFGLSFALFRRADGTDRAS